MHGNNVRITKERSTFRLTSSTTTDNGVTTDMYPSCGGTVVVVGVFREAGV